MGGAAVRAPTSVRGLRAYLRRGGVIAYPTASCFGLGCDPNSAAGVRLLLRHNGRPQHKGLILIADRFERLQPYVARLSSAERLRVEEKWPGPHTWLLPASRRASRSVRGKHDKLAVRVDAHPDCVALCRHLKMALVSTSANRTGRRPVRSYRECVRLFGAWAKVVPGRIGKQKNPSTIQDLENGLLLRG